MSQGTDLSCVTQTDVDAVFERIANQGISATAPAMAFYGMKQTFVTDPDGCAPCFESLVGRTGGSFAFEEDPPTQSMGLMEVTGKCVLLRLQELLHARGHGFHKGTVGLGGQE